MTEVYVMKINDIDWSKVPDILAKEQVRLLCHCSKRTALYYLKSGKLPCIYSGKKTRCYKIRKEDLMAFIEDRENHPEFYAVPEGWYKESGRTVRQHYSSEIKIDGEDLHEYYRFLLKEYPDVLEVKKVSEITGYAISPRSTITDGEKSTDQLNGARLVRSTRNMPTRIRRKTSC